MNKCEMSTVRDQLGECASHLEPTYMTHLWISYYVPIRDNFILGARACDSCITMDPFCLNGLHVLELKDRVNGARIQRDVPFLVNVRIYSVHTVVTTSYSSLGMAAVH